MSPIPEVTVVIATHNRRVLVEEAVASVRLQRGVTWELILVDDASTDDTERVFSGAPDLTYHRLERHRERSIARNQGLERAGAPLVMFLDDDDVLHAGALSTLARAMRAHPGAVAAVGARQDWFVGEDYRRRDIHPWRERTRDLFDALLFGWSAVSGQNLFRTAVVRAVGGYNETLIPCEDRDLWLRLARQGPVVLRPETVMTYRMLPTRRLPPDIRSLRERVAERAILALPADRQPRARRIRQATRAVDAAEDAVMAGHPARALAEVAAAVVDYPALAATPWLSLWITRRLVGRAYHRWRGR